MRNLTLQDLKLALIDLLEHRVEALSQTHAGQIFLPTLGNLRRKIEALPIGEDGELVADLAREDARHDGYATALWLMTEAYMRMPDLPAADREVLAELRGGLLPRPSELSASYANEAARALQRGEALTAEHRASLERFPVRGGRTLFDWMQAYVASGHRLQRLLSQWSVSESFGEGYDASVDAGRLRGRTISLLAQLRETLHHELWDDQERWHAVDASSFEYIDRLAEHRETECPPEPREATKRYAKLEA